MLKLFRLVFLFLIVPCASAQTVANFDSPACNGNGVRIYQGIDFSLSPWDCERPGLSGDATETISWYVNNTSGKFKFVTPSVLTSLRASSSSGTGNITISTDAGEKVTFAAQPGVMPPPVLTAFTKAASVVTVSFPGGWTIELDDITYTAPAPPPPPTITAVAVACSSLAVVFGGTSNCTATVTGTGAFDNGVNWTASDGLISAGGIFTAPSVAESVIVTAISIQDPSKAGTSTIVVSRPPISMDLTLSWDDQTPIIGTVQVQQVLGMVNTVLTTFTLDATGNLKGPVSLDLSQPDPLVLTFALVDSSGKAVGNVQETVPKAMFAGVTRVVASLTVGKSNLALKGISWASQ